MKKSLLLASTLLLAMLFNVPAFAEEDKLADAGCNFKMPPMHREMPKLYDKNGKELTAPPKKGQKVYDAKGNELPPPPKMDKKMPPKPDLNLTEAQKAKMDKIREESKKKMKPIRKQIHDYQNQIWEIKENDSLSCEQKRKKIQPIFEKIQKLQKQKNEIRKADMQQFESLLTKEQKQKLEQFKKTHKPPMKHHHPHHPPMMPVFPD